MNRTQRFHVFEILSVLGIITCLGFTFFFFIHPPAYTFELKQTGIRFSIWPSEKAHSLRWVWIGIAVALVLTVSLFRKAAVRLGKGVASSITQSMLDYSAPLTLLPLACIPLFLADLLPPLLGTNLRFFLVIGIFSLLTARLVSPFLEPVSSTSGHDSQRQTILWALFVLIAFFSVFAFGGYRFSKTVGEHVGDEGHYLIQAQSLFEDRNLDLTNQLLTSLGLDDASQISLHRHHISSRSRGDALYSVHPYGLSLLLAPSWKWGLGGRHIVLGLISGVGLAGLFLLCRRMGVGNGASLVAVASLGVSVFWGIYSFRALPEILAATLVVWTFWAIAVQRERPWLSLLVAAGCCIYLPFAHTRFIPLSLMGIGLYGLFGLLGAEAWRDKLIRLAAFTGFCVAGYGLYMTMQYAMFATSGNYPVIAILFSYPMGAWEIFVSDRGLLSLFPVFFWLAGAMIAWCVVDRENRWFCLGIMATFLAGLLTSATYPWYTGGSSLPGRYLIATSPLLFVGTAVMLERVHLAARTWFVFLSLFSTLILILVWAHLPDIGREFIMPLHTLTSFPLLQDFYFPHASFRDGANVNTLWTNAYAATVLLLTTSMILLRKRFARLSFLATILALSLGMMAQSRFDFDRFSFQRHMKLLEVDNAFVVRRETSRHLWSQSIEMALYHSNTGRTEQREKLSVKVARHELDGPGELAWGRYTYIFPSTFDINFDYEISGCDPDCLVATIDVTKDHGHFVMASERIVCGDPDPPRSLTATTDSFLVIEPRVVYHGCGDITVSRISITER